MEADPTSTDWMGRFHALSEPVIAGLIRGASPGNFALGYVDGSTFQVFYVGRSDCDLGSSLNAWVGAPSHPRRHRPSPHDPWRSRSGPPAGLGTRALGFTALGIDTAYTHFAFRCAPSAIAAYERECIDFHELGGSENLDNDCHPDPPPDMRWACPVDG